MDVPALSQERREREHAENPAEKDNLKNMDVVADMANDCELRGNQKCR